MLLHHYAMISEIEFSLDSSVGYVISYFDLSSSNVNPTKKERRRVNLHGLYYLQ